MKGENSRIILIEKLDSFIKNLSPDKANKLELEIRHDKVIDFAKFLSIKIGRTTIESLSDPELFWLLNAAAKVSATVGKIEDYFEAGEVKSYKYYVPAEKEEVKFPLVFKEAFRLAENQYAFPLSVRDIKRLKEANILQVIPDLQRNSTKNKYNELVVKVNTNSAKEIGERITEGKFFFNAVRFNLMDDGEADTPVFDETSRTLTVYNGMIIVPDGNHRTIGAELATNHLDDRFVVLFTFLSAYDSRAVINQEWTTVPIPRKHRESMKQNFPNEIVDNIMRSNDADPIYSKEIMRDGNETKNGRGFLIYSELADAINLYYQVDKMETKNRRTELSEWIIRFMNHVTEELLEDFKNYKKVRRTSWAVSPIACYYYMMLSKLVYGDENWRSEVSAVLKQCNFKDPEAKKLLSSQNKRRIFEFIKGEEEKACTILNKKSNS